MPHTARASQANYCYHVLNRGNAHAQIFHKPADYASFVELIEAAAVVAELNALGIETVMLTGDNRTTAESMARELGILEHRSGLLPEDKAAAIVELNQARGATGMVGDGVNDAPALGTKALVLALAVFGLAAILADVGVSLLVTANALRLLRRA